MPQPSSTEQNHPHASAETFLKLSMFSFTCCPTLAGDKPDLQAKTNRFSLPQYLESFVCLPIARFEFYVTNFSNVVDLR